MTFLTGFLVELLPFETALLTGFLDFLTIFKNKKNIQQNYYIIYLLIYQTFS